MNFNGTGRLGKYYSRVKPVLGNKKDNWCVEKICKTHCFTGTEGQTYNPNSNCKIIPNFFVHFVTSINDAFIIKILTLKKKKL